MKKLTKRLKIVGTLSDKNKLYNLKDAITILKKAPKLKFDEMVEVSAKLTVDPKQSQSASIRGTVALPHGTGKKVVVAVFCKGEEEKRARDAGADFIGSDELIAKVQGGWVGFDVAIATPEMMKDLSKLGKILGPRGLMPNPKSGTVTMETAKTIKDVKAGKIEFKMDKQAGVHAPLGKLSFTDAALYANAVTLIDAIMSSNSGGLKGQHVKNLFISTTMGPGIKLDLAEFRK
ncbi:MAG: 50S ribosomal protein L1 [Candidatus Omnitrophica bacterium]|nr:50S ribosomal protein L1 [Candidatus Omnitrophota bacterium]MBU1808921.1 50S ribosomal protein L1 [Candidatus Omnitrophota bacterium]